MHLLQVLFALGVSSNVLAAALRLMRCWRVCVALLLLSLVGSVHAQRPADGRVARFALVIGNAAYVNGPLVNPVNDARAMAARLREFGFDVTLHENLRIRQIGSIYREFRTKITPGATALVFYAGHGVQVKGQNYFPAIDAEIASEEDVPLQSLNLGSLLENMEEAKAGVSLVFLDACRDNPFARRFRSGSRGLAKVESASGTLIHYATKPGSVADDGDGRNGTYTEALLREMGAPGLPVELMLKRVTNQVVSKTKGKQEPWIEGSLRGDFFFNGNVATSLAAPPGQVASIRPDAAVTPPAVASNLIAAMTPGTVFRDCAECPEMVVVPAGSFTMGSPDAEETRRPTEGPRRRVSISRPFATGKFEVTFDEWDACLRDGGCQYQAPDNAWGRGRRPVVNVSWQDAKAYTEWLSRKTGHRYRLPSEAEWEYAARAGTTTAFSTGDRITPQQASYNTSVSYAGSPVAAFRAGTAPVGSYPANAFGLHDMHGNVWEWTEDCLNPNYAGAPADGAVWSTGDCAQRVLRGGSWSVYPQILRSAFRSWLSPLIRNYTDFGFRVTRVDAEPAGNKPAIGVPASGVTTPPAQATTSVAHAFSGATAPALAAMKPGTVFRDCADCPEMVLIPTGKFQMGSPPTEEQRFPNEGPQRTVAILAPLALGKFEVTRAEFGRFVLEARHAMGPGCTIARPVPPTPPPHPPRIVRNDPSHDWLRPGYEQGDNHPVTCVSWDDARAYTEWLSRKSGKRYRLPTEAEWEYAARAGSTGPFSFGARITPQQANYYTLLSYGGSPVAPLRQGTTPVGSYPANAFGLHDVHGNLFEWVEDCLNHHYDGAPTNGTAWTAGDCSVRMMRGGYYGEGPVWLRSAKRDGAYAVERAQRHGFRLARVD